MANGWTHLSRDILFDKIERDKAKYLKRKTFYATAVSVGCVLGFVAGCIVVNILPRSNLYEQITIGIGFVAAIVAYFAYRRSASLQRGIVDMSEAIEIIQARENREREIRDVVQLLISLPQGNDAYKAFLVRRQASFASPEQIPSSMKWPNAN